jgi:hypothetical protein
MIGQSISQFPELPSIQPGDRLLVQRGDKYYSINSANYCGCFIGRSYELTDVQMNSLGSSPVELIPAPGVDKYIEIIDAVAFRNASSYGCTDAQLFLTFTGFAQAHFQSSSDFLNEPVGGSPGRVEKMLPIDSATGQHLRANLGISAYLLSDPPSTGGGADGPTVIEITYKVHNFS